MKKVAVKIAVGLVIFFAMCTGLYFCGAFVAWNFDAGKWDAAGRFILAFLGVPLCAGVSLLIADGGDF